MPAGQYGRQVPNRQRRRPGQPGQRVAGQRSAGDRWGQQRPQQRPNVAARPPGVGVGGGRSFAQSSQRGTYGGGQAQNRRIGGPAAGQGASAAGTRSDPYGTGQRPDFGTPQYGGQGQFSQAMREWMSDQMMGGPPSQLGGGQAAGGGVGGQQQAGGQSPVLPPPSHEMVNALADYSQLPQLNTAGMQNPAGYFNPAMQGAQNQVNNVMGGQGLYQGPQGNPFLQQGGNILGQMNYGQQQLPNQPNAPNIQGAPTSYDPQFNFGGPQIQQFDPNSVQGPNMPQITGAQGNFGGPQTGVPGFSELAALGQQQQNPNIAREQLGSVGGLGQSTLGNTAFDEALRQQKALAGGGGSDPSQALAAIRAENEALVGQAYTGGAQAAAGRGFTDPGSSVAGLEIGKQLAPVIAGQSARAQEAILGASGANAQQRAAAAAGLTQLGGAASQAAQGAGGLTLEQQQGLNQGNIAQRGQDMQMAQTMGQRGNNMSDVANLVRATSGANIGAYGAGTERGLGQGEQDLQAQQMAQQGALGAYGAQTQRQGTQGGIFNQGQQNVIGGFNAGTQQGNVAGQLGLGYDQLGAANQNQFNQAQNQQYGTQANMYGMGGQMANQAYANQTNRYGTGMQGAGGMGQTYQQGGVQAGQQQLGAAQLGAQIMQGGAGAEQAWNQLNMLAQQGNQDALYQMWQMRQQRKMQQQMASNQQSMQNQQNVGQFASAGNLISLLSDRNQKENITPINEASLLEKLQQLNVSEWNYIADEQKTKHIGPMAQDFQEVFGIGDDTSINIIDALGIALSAVKALALKVDKLEGMVGHAI